MSSAAVPYVAVIGNPNTGKSTLFSALTGIHTRIGNYPGVTVEKKLGELTHQGKSVTLVDLPGTYSLSPRSLDEMVSVDVLLGRQSELGAVAAVVCILDASNLERNLYLTSQVLDCGLPTVVVLNLWDVAEQRGITIDVAELSRRLGAPVIPCQAHRRQNLDAVRDAIFAAVGSIPAPATRPFPPAFLTASGCLQEWLASRQVAVPTFLVDRLLIDQGGVLEQELTLRLPDLVETLQRMRSGLEEAGFRVPAAEAKSRYAWVRRIVEGAITVPATRPTGVSDHLDRWLTHRVWGLLAFSLVMFSVFVAIYVGAAPLMQLLESAQQQFGQWVGQLLPEGPLKSLVVDGIIAGVGGVLMFLPQIALLFLFIAVLEDCGYLARAAFLMDKLMTQVGLSGKSFVPLMSSFACAVPGIMATRTIENWRDRMVTILIAPLMSCSARLPVYTLMIGAFVPDVYWGGWLPARGALLFGMTSLGAIVAVPIAWLLKQTFFRGETPPFVMELPSYKWPSAGIVSMRVYDRVRAFVVRAGTLIFATNVLVWAACYFPGSHAEQIRLTQELDRLTQAQPEQKDASQATEADSDHAAQVAAVRTELNAAAERALQESFLGRLGRGLEPIVRPLGWDWRIGVAVLASFPAREVVVAMLGTIYSLGREVEESDEGLWTAMKSATWPDGRPVFTLPVAVGIMVFFALCAQCGSTLMVIRRETNSWRWAAFTFFYMTALAYVATLIAYRGLTALGL